MASPVFRYQKLILPIALWLFSLILLSVQSYQKGRSKPTPFSRATAEVISFPQRSYSYTVNGASRFFRNYLYLVKIREQNLSLQKQLAMLQMENQQLEAQAGETERLRALLNFKESTKLESIAARIIGWDLSVYAQNIVINKGGKDGIAKGQAVICHQGLIGQIVDEPGRVITRDRAPVLMITDPTSRVSVVVERTRDRAILQGMGRDDRMLLTYLSPDAKVRGRGTSFTPPDWAGFFPQGSRRARVIKIEYNAMLGSDAGMGQAERGF